MRALAFCGLLLLCQPLVWASALHSLRFSHLGGAQGLPGGSVISLLQDRHGLVWMGTTAGLARFDGQAVKTFKSRPEQADSLSHSLVEALLEDEQGVLWIGTRGGLDRMPLASEKVERQSMPESFSLAERRVLAVAPAGPQRLWVGTVGGLLMFNTAERRFVDWQRPGGERLSLKRPIRALLPDGQGGVWVGESHEVLRINAQGQVLYQFGTLNGLGADAMAASDLHVSTLALDGQGRIWVGMVGGLQTWRWAEGQNKDLAPRPDPLGLQLKLPRDRVYSLLRDRDQAMWIGAFNRPALYRWQEGAKNERGEPVPGRLDTFVKLPSVDSSLSEDSVASLMQDRSGGLWVGTLSGGVSLADLGGR
ncbi:MAG: hypothetical protein K2W93_14295, partial [Burkholderiaceae bacterium]|nr:hypothetical protein [Burkholderiaceae bacterium]